MTNKLQFDPSVVPDERPGPSGGRRAKNRAERTAALCRSARDLFLQEGIDNARIDGIASQAGMSKAAFYRYFEHKAAIVDALFDALGKAVLTALDRAYDALRAAKDPAGVEAAYASLGMSMLEIFTAEPGLVKLFLQERQGAPTDERRPVLALDAAVTERAMQLTRAAQAGGWVKAFRPEVSTVAVLGAAYELLWRRLNRQGAVVDDLEAVDQLVDLVLHGVRRTSVDDDPDVMT